MAGFLDSTYGVADARRERRTKLIVLSSVALLLLGGILYFTFRNWKEERAVKQFLSLLEQKKYQDAYKLWDANKYYGPDRFIEDWGPSGEFKDVTNAKVDAEDTCGSGVFFFLHLQNAKTVALLVQSNTNLLGFAPPGWERCPGRHLQLWEYLKSRFSAFTT
jgi:hypothetical protein